MSGKFHEIKAVEDAVKIQIDEARKKGELEISRAENQEETEMIKMRQEIKQKRHQFLDAAKKEAEIEAQKILSEADEEIKRIEIDSALLGKTAKKLSQQLFS